MSDKQIEQFLEVNFPPYESYDIKENTKDKAVLVIHYGRKDNLKVTIGYADESSSFLELLRTDFI